MLNIFILIRSLNVGGAERQVCVLANALHSCGHAVTVGVFYSGGALETQLQEQGIRIHALHKKGRWDLIGWFLRYLKALKDIKPDVVYSFMTTSNIVATLGRLFSTIPIVWGIRASVVNLKDYDWLAGLCLWLEKKMSYFAPKVIFNAHSSVKHHQALGYHLNNAVVIPNGIETEVFKPDPNLKVTARQGFGVPEGSVLIGMVARYDPMKDYATFLKAAHNLLTTNKNMYFLMAGQGVTQAIWPELADDHPGNFIYLDHHHNMPALYNALDIMVLCSFGEGFPNVVGEAMACEVPVIVTDVGDCAYIVGERANIIPVNDPGALVQAIETVLKNPPEAGSLRRRIVENFTVETMVTHTLASLTPPPCCFMKIIHLVTGLGMGGAERQLAALVEVKGASQQMEHIIISLQDEGIVGKRLIARGISVYCLNLQKSLKGLWTLFKILRTEKPDILQTWLYHADLSGLIIGRLALIPVIIWNVRCSNMDMSRYSKLSRFVLGTLVKLSHFPDAVGNEFSGRTGLSYKNRLCPQALGKNSQWH